MPRLLIVGLVILSFALLFPLAVARAADKSADQLRAAYSKGNYKDAYDGLSAMLFTPEGTDRLGDDLELCANALQSLGRADEQNDLLEKTITAHNENWPLLARAALIYRDRVNHYGVIVAGKFYRGDHRGNDGKWVSSIDRDRTRALQLELQATTLLAKDAKPNREAQAQFYYDFAATLMYGQNGPDAWRLQFLTDLSQLPDYEETNRYGWYYYDRTPRGAPVDTQGNPVFHSVPKSWDASISDGQRWRWCLLQAAELSPSMANTVRWHFATFLRNQFDVQTMAYYGNLFRHSEDDAKKDDSGPFAVWNLGEDETIAKLASGIKRFKLPDEYNFIKILQTISNDPNGGHQSEALELLGQVFEDRQQYPKAADYWRDCIKRFGPGDNNYRQRRLEQIIGNLAMFENVLTQPAGDTGAAVQMRFRNGKKISFEAREIKVAALLDDVKAYLREKPKQLKWEQIDLSNIGYRLVDNNQAKYVGDKAAAWDLDLQPRDNHFDRRITVQTPLKKAGAYLLTGKMENGNVSRIVIWVADTVIVRKPLSDASMTYLADASTGEPIAGAKVDFFGYRQAWIKDNNYRLDIAEKSDTTNADGISLVTTHQLANDKEEPANEGLNKQASLPNNFSWITTATTKDGRFAFQGFASIWYSSYSDPYDYQYNQTKAFVMTDRPVYRPGQTVKWKMWIGHNKYDQDGKSPFAGQTTSVELRSPKGTVIKSFTGTLDEFGGIDGEYVLENEATLGSYGLTQPNSWGGVGFRVEEYKKPEFEVKVDAPTEPVMLGEKVPAKITAKYYFGAPVTAAKVKYKVTRTAHDARWYPAAHWDWFYEPGYWWFACDYTWYPGWRDWGCRRPFHAWWGGWSREQPEVVLDGDGSIQPDGTFSIDIDTAVAKAAYSDQDHKYEITAEVTDASRRTIVGTGSVLVARKPFKVYAWVDRGHYSAGDTIRANFCAQTLDNKPVQGKGSLRLLKISYDKDQKPLENEVQHWNLDPKEDGTAEVQIKAAQPGQYRLSYTVTDAKNHTIEGGYVFLIRGEGFAGKEFRFNDIEITTDKKEYAAGEKVKLLVNANHENATILLFVRPSNGIYLAPKIIRMKGKSAVEEVEVGKKDMPNFFIEALTISDARIYTDVREVIVPPEDRILNVSVTADSTEYRPGQKAKFTVKVTEKNGEPFTGATVVTLYDKAVEYISGGPNVADIRKFFWQWRRSHYVRTESSLDRYSGNLVHSGEIAMSFLGVFGYQATEFGDDLGRLQRAGRNERELEYGHRGSQNGLRKSGGGGVMFDATVTEAAAAPAASKALAVDAEKGDGDQMVDKRGAAAGPESANQPTVRSNFADTALWSPRLITAKDGTAEFELSMPENLTTWKARVWTLGNGTRVGQADTEVVTKKNLIVRLESPRFFVQKDEVVLSSIVHNYLKTAKDVRVALELDGGCLVTIGGKVPADFDSREHAYPQNLPTTVTVRVEPNKEARIDWRVQVIKEGTATVRMKALTNEESDATQQTFPVYIHGMLKTDSFSGAIRGDAKSAAITFTVPKERRIEDSRLEIRYSPSLASAMVDALPYMADYPYGCTEQTLNRFVPTVITQKILLDMKLDLADIQKKRTNLNAQEIGDDAQRAKDWGHHGDYVSTMDRREYANPVFDKEEVIKMVREGVTKLSNMQLSDGGWGWFSGYGEQSWPHTTAVVVHGLQIAKANGASVDDAVLNRGIQWLENWQQKEFDWIMAKRKERTCSDIHAFVYMVLVDAGHDHKKFRELLFEDRTHLSVYCKAMFGLALEKVGDKDKLDMILDNIRQFVVTDDENQSAYLKMPEGYAWWYWYNSDMEANAYYLKLLARTDPKGKTASGLAKYLINNRKHATYWNSTRDTALCIEALADYIRASGEDSPDMTVKIALDGKPLKEVKISRENFFSYDNKLVLLANQVTDGPHKVEITRDGTGPVYFNAYLSNFTLEDHITRAGLEIKINRKFFRLDRADKVIKAEGDRGQAVDKRVEKYVRTELQDLASVKSGELVEIELEVDSKNDYEYIILEDMKAAGFEPVEVRSGYNGNDMNAYVEFRDNRVVFFARALARGKHSVSYRLRAEIPGKFSALPAKAGAMYAPELRGNSDEIKLRIEDVPAPESLEPKPPERRIPPVRTRNDKNRP